MKGMQAPNFENESSLIQSNVCPYRCVAGRSEELPVLFGDLLPKVVELASVLLHPALRQSRLHHERHLALPANTSLVKWDGQLGITRSCS